MAAILKRLHRFGWLTNSSKILPFEKCIPKFIKIGSTVRPLSCSQTYIYMSKSKMNDYYFWILGTSKRISIVVPGLGPAMRATVIASFFLWKFAKIRMELSTIRTAQEIEILPKNGITN